MFARRLWPIKFRSFGQVVLSRTPGGDLFWDLEGTKCKRCHQLVLGEDELCSTNCNIWSPNLWKCFLFRFQPEAGLITLTLANGMELNYQRPTSQFIPDIVTSELIWHFFLFLKNNWKKGMTCQSNADEADLHSVQPSCVFFSSAQLCPEI